MKNFLEIIKQRRSIYQLNNKLPVSDDELLMMLDHLVVELPSAFNSQSTKIVVLLGNAHSQLWNITKETLRKKVAPEQFDSTDQKINSFAEGYGTILFFDDTSITKQFSEDFALYKDNFPIWANQSNGIMQFSVWTALAEKNIGASLQHYNPLIDGQVKKVFDIPTSYQLVAQMPFGGIDELAGQKESKLANEIISIRN